MGYFDSPRKALEAASEMFPDGISSLQEVTDEPIDLGFWSHVGNFRQCDFTMNRSGRCTLRFG